MIDSAMIWNEPNNLSHWDFQLDPEDMERLRGMDRPDGRLGPDPDTADF